MERERFARPKAGAKVVVSFRLEESAYDDLRRCALTANSTMTDWLKNQIEEYKQQSITEGVWNEALNR